MKFELRHIIPILILATFMTGCTDSPLPDAAPEAPTRPLSFSIPSATLDPTYPHSRATDPDLTEEIVLWQGEQVFPAELNYNLTLPGDGNTFPANNPAVGGKITVVVKNLQELPDNAETGEKNPRVYFISKSWMNNGLDNGYTPNWEGNGSYYYQLDISESFASEMQKSGLKILGAGCTVTKITYTAMRTGGLIYDGLHTQFIDGSLLGCVIAYKDASAEGGYAYKANSCWTWHEEGLILTKLFDADNLQLDISNNTIIRHFTDEECAEIDKADDPLKSYFIKLLDETAEYTFFFYYPYVDEEIITKAFTSSLGEKVNDWDPNCYNISSIPYPLTDYNDITKYGDVLSASDINNRALIRPLGQMESVDDNTKLYRAAWTAYPVATHTDNSLGDKKARLHNVDFMYCKVTSTDESTPISAATAKSEIRVTMQKKLVTMDLYVLQDVSGSSLKLRPGQSSDYTPAMRRIKRFDLCQGRFIDDFAYNNDNIFNQNSRFSTDIIPCKIGSSSEMINGEPTVYDVYRVILPPQDASQFRCSLTFKVKGDGNERELTLHDMHQNSGIKSLQEGHYYKLRFTKLNEQYGFHLDIDDWEKGDEITIDRPD